MPSRRSTCSDPRTHCMSQVNLTRLRSSSGRSPCLRALMQAVGLTRASNGSCFVAWNFPPSAVDLKMAFSIGEVVINTSTSSTHVMDVHAPFGPWSRGTACAKAGKLLVTGSCNCQHFHAIPQEAQPRRKNTKTRRGADVRTQKNMPAWRGETPPQHTAQYMHSSLVLPVIASPHKSNKATQGDPASMPTFERTRYVDAAVLV